MPATDPHLTARKTPGAGLKDTEAQIDMARLRSYRLARVREQLKRYDYGACVLFDPINIRYATGTTWPCGPSTAQTGTPSCRPRDP